MASVQQGCINKEMLKEVVDYYQKEMTTSVNSLEEFLVLIEDYCNDKNHMLTSEELAIFKKEIGIIREKSNSKKQEILIEIKRMGNELVCE